VFVFCPKKKKKSAPMNLFVKSVPPKEALLKPDMQRLTLHAT